MKRLMLFLLVIVVAFAAFVATRPGTFHVERSATISASPVAIQAHLEDFHAWPGWSPWEKLDPNMKRTHEGAPSGVGAVYAWVGNGDVGEGRMTITEVEPASRVAIRSRSSRGRVRAGGGSSSRSARSPGSYSRASAGCWRCDPRRARRAIRRPPC